MKITNTGILPTAHTILVPVVQESTYATDLTTRLREAGITAVLPTADFKAEAKEILVLYPTHPDAAYQKIILIGLGKNPTYADTNTAFRSVAYRYKEKLGSHLALLATDAAALIEPAINGLLLGAYDLGLYKTEEKTIHPFAKDDTHLLVVTQGTDAAIAERAIEKAQLLAHTQLRIYDLVNAPGNKVRAAELVTWAFNSAKEYGYAATNLAKETLIDVGMDALLAVNRGSEHNPAFIIVEYQSAHTPATHTIGLVGKGVTFDTGGVSIKPSANMHMMKSDMGGAAAVLGAVEAAAKLQLPIRVVGIIPATDNLVGTTAIKPGDVIGSYAGKTIEVIDTDAEGRLILADGLAYMQKNFKPDVLLDLATLTGSCIQTLGYHAAGLFTNNDELAQAIAAAGDSVGERVWRLPLWDAYNEDVKSDVADLKNFSGKPTAGAISAAKFLEVFTEKHPAWAHLDIAGVAYTASEYTLTRSATAYGIQLLIAFMERWRAAS